MEIQRKISPITICIDFDGTCVTHNYPELGKEIGAVKVLKQLIENGHNLILYTMRSNHNEEKELEGGYKIHKGDFLQQAVDWFSNNGIPLYGIQRNPTQDEWTQSPKCYAQLYIDDAALGCPLRYDENLSNRPFVDWEIVEEILKIRKIIK